MKCIMTGALLLFLVATPVFAERFRNAAPPAPPPAPAQKGLKVHEWGVFANGRAGGGGAPPTFIQKVTVPEPPPGQSESEREDANVGGVVKAFEPILHVYAPGPLALHVEVGFPGGRPEFAWPWGKAGWSVTPCGREQMPSLAWDLQVGGKEGAEPPKVPEDHWINAVRKVGSDLVRSSNGRDAERFLFYEGPVDYNSGFAVRFDRADPDKFVISGYGAREAWVIRSIDKKLLRARLTGLAESAGERTRPTVTEPQLEGSSVEALRIELAQALVGTGLSEAEAGALLTIWMPGLLNWPLAHFGVRG